MIKKIKELKNLPLLLALIGVIAVPMAVKTYALESNDPPSENQTEQIETPEEEVEEPVEEPETPEEPVVETPEEEVEEPVEEPETPIVDDGVTLGEAQIIAQAEHAGTIKEVKTKVIDGNAVYVFKFEDGWKVAVRAIDGVVVEVKDTSDKKHGCKNKLKDDAQFQAWLEKKKNSRKHQRANFESGEVSGRSRKFKTNNHKRGGWNR